MDGVTRANRSEFYLIPQKVNRGTATPSLYQIIDNDNSKILMEDIITITYNLTYDYLNWPGPIRVPSVLQNAAKLAALLS